MQEAKALATAWQSLFGETEGAEGRNSDYHSKLLTLHFSLKHAVCR